MNEIPTIIKTNGTMTANEIYVKWFGSMNTPTRRSLVKNNVIQAMEEFADLQVAESLGREYAGEDVLEERIRELEADNKRLRESLERIITAENMTGIAKQALEGLGE